MKKLILVFVVLLAATAAFAQSMPPTIFYSDLTSGPNTGGKSNAGAFVTIHGKGFGSSRGSSTVTTGGGTAGSYASWSDSAVTFQLGSSAKTGSIVVKVGGVTSNGVPFMVRAGNIYFVSSSGNDSKSGSYTSPWCTITHASNTMKAGDIVYVESQSTRSTASSGTSGNSSLVLSSGGTASAPMAIVAYPNSAVMIGSSTGLAIGVNITASNWVLSGLTLRGAQAAVSIAGVSGIRLTSSDVSCPNGYGSGSCIAVNGGSSLAILGNNIHDNGSTTNTNLESYQTMYLLGTNGVEIGWNTITNTQGCNAIGVHSDTGSQYSYLVHDNYIYDTRCEAIALGTVDPSQGAVNVYNNIIENSGTGPAPGGTPEGYGYAAIVIGGGSGTPVQVYNNTIYNAGAFGGASAGAVRAFGATNFTNNIFDVLSGQQYVSLDTDLSWVTGSNNLFFGAGNPLGVFSDSVVGDPTFVSVAANNFHLQAGSPAIDSGATVQLATDYDGVSRPQGSAYDIGAYEYPEQGSVAGTLSASPASLSLETVTVGQTATSTTVLSNSGSTSVTISQANSNNSNFQASGITFPLTLNAGQSATLTVSFVPTSAGSASGTIAIASNASNTPTNIAVTSTAVAAAPVVSLSPASLTFGNQTVGTTSAAQTVTLSNTGTAALALSSIAASSNYAQTNTCGTSLAVNASCTISVTFKPTTTGSLTGGITLTDNAASSPQAVSLAGTAVATAAPVVSLSPSSLPFASQTVGTTSAAQAVTLTNTGTAALTLSSIAASGNYAETNTCGTSLAVNASCTISVTFKPTASGTLTGAITLTDNAASSPQAVSLAGTAVAAVPVVSLSPTSLTFASQTVGTTSAAQAITLTNTGTAALTLSSIVASGSYAETNTCGTSLAANASCTISVTFTPTSAGTPTGAITLTDNAAASPQAVSLTGTAVAASVPVVSLSPSSLTFGSLTVGVTSAAQTVTLTNAGPGALTLSSIAASGNYAQTNTCGTNLAANASCTISVTFKPTASGTLTGAITLTDNAASSPQAVSLTGTAWPATPDANLSTASLTFASQTVGTTSAAQAITLSNSGTGALTISSIAASGNYAETNNCGTTLAVNASCTISVTFTPAASGTLTGAITLTDNAASSPQAVSLSGTAVGAATSGPVVSLSPASLTFASQTVGTTSAAQTVTLTNTGSAALTLSSIAASGNYAQTNTCGTSLAANASCTISVTFAPTTSGSLPGALELTDNAASSPQSVSLSGTAAAAAGVQPSVALSWSESSSSVSGYNVYRSTQSGTAYTKVNSSLLASQSYTDGSVASGQTYYYVVTSVNSSGVESAYSSQASAVIPTT
jgi:hypothetical protein